MTPTREWVKGELQDYAATFPWEMGAMIDEEDSSTRKRSRLEKLVLDTLGIEELRDYIAELQAEIARVEADIERKQGHRSAADAFFRRPS
jgi:uncharacterized small protein (DUF1192 family)